VRHFDGYVYALSIYTPIYYPFFLYSLPGPHQDLLPSRGRGCGKRTVYYFYGSSIRLDICHSCSQLQNVTTDPSLHIESLVLHFESLVCGQDYAYNGDWMHG